MREELVAKRYLCAKIAGPLILEYYLLVSPLAEDLEIYGVKIVERRSGVAAIAPGLTTSGRKILHLIDLLSKGTVTPTSLADIVEDWLSRYQEPHLHEGAVFVILCETMEDCTMEKKIQLPKEAQPWTEVEVLFIDGCKVTVRYSRQKNPSAVKVIKETLLVSGTTRKI